MSIHSSTVSTWRGKELLSDKKLNQNDITNPVEQDYRWAELPSVYT